MGVVKGGPRPKIKKPPARIIFWLKKPEKLRIFFSWPKYSSRLDIPTPLIPSSSRSVDSWTVGHSKLAVARVPVPKFEHHHKHFYGEQSRMRSSSGSLSREQRHRQASKPNGKKK